MPTSASASASASQSRVEAPFTQAPTRTTENVQNTATTATNRTSRFHRNRSGKLILNGKLETKGLGREVIGGLIMLGAVFENLGSLFTPLAADQVSAVLTVFIVELVVGAAIYLWGQRAHVTQLEKNDAAKAAAQRAQQAANAPRTERYIEVTGAHGTFLVDTQTKSMYQKSAPPAPSPVTVPPPPPGYAPYPPAPPPPQAAYVPYPPPYAAPPPMPVMAPQQPAPVQYVPAPPALRTEQEFPGVPTR